MNPRRTRKQQTRKQDHTGAPVLGFFSGRKSAVTKETVSFKKKLFLKMADDFEQLHSSKSQSYSSYQKLLATEFEQLLATKGADNAAKNCSKMGRFGCWRYANGSQSFYACGRIRLV